MKVANRGVITEFITRHPDAAGAARTWLEEANSSKWQTPHAVKNSFPKASLLKGGRRFIFNLRGGHYRLDVKIDYERQQCLVVRIGTHQEYDSWKFEE
jgi:mRNA interferase HigB